MKLLKKRVLKRTVSFFNCKAANKHNAFEISDNRWQKTAAEDGTTSVFLKQEL
ncbi:hypothetical protein [Flavobacterium sp.]|uniref:hypothetical protein n=1 Tax=Flavobacterium sp. TaxID=239 RepID=UPI0025B8F11F|nr:hypothetical protein [Flavobacterium sp.]